eukprot:587575-Amphidinium_carterae.1
MENRLTRKRVECKCYRKQHCQDQGGHPRMSSKHMKCGFAAHPIKSCTRAVKLRPKDARASFAEEGNNLMVRQLMKKKTE